MKKRRKRRKPQPEEIQLYRVTGDMRAFCQSFGFRGGAPGDMIIVSADGEDVINVLPEQEAKERYGHLRVRKPTGASPVVNRTFFNRSKS